MSKGSTTEPSEDPARTNLRNSVAKANTGQGRGRNNTQCNANSAVILLNPANYEGECKRVGVVLGLRAERLHKKASYEQFIEKLCNYIVQAYADGADIKVLLVKGRDLIKAYKTKFMLKPLSEQEQE